MFVAKMFHDGQDFFARGVNWTSNVKTATLFTTLPEALAGAEKIRTENKASQDKAIEIVNLD